MAVLRFARTGTLTILNGTTTSQELDLALEVPTGTNPNAPAPRQSWIVTFFSPTTLPETVNITATPNPVGAGGSATYTKYAPLNVATPPALTQAQANTWIIGPVSGLQLLAGGAVAADRAFPYLAVLSQS